MSHVHDGLNDDQLLGALHAAITARRAVPVKFVQTATDAYAWHDIYAELARLSCDCGRDRDMLALLSRSPPGRLKGTAFSRRFAPQSRRRRGPLARGGDPAGLVRPPLASAGTASRPLVS